MSKLKEIRERHERDENSRTDYVPDVGAAHQDRGELLKMLEAAEAKLAETQKRLRKNICTRCLRNVTMEIGRSS